MIVFLLVALAGAASVAAAAEGAARGTNDVTIRRDTWGVPHIFAATLADGAFGAFCDAVP